MLNISREKISRSYYSINLFSKNLKSPRIELYVEFRESTLKSHKDDLKGFIEQQALEYAKSIGWVGLDKYEFTMFPSSISKRIEKLQSK